MSADPVIHALIPAAGRGHRFGDALLKQYVPLAGRPVLAHSIAAVWELPQLSGVTVVLSPEDEQFQDLIAPMFPGVRTAIGGDTRARSVLNGLLAIKDSDPAADWVLVHDAARPCLPADCLRRLVKQGLGGEDGALLAVPLRDTLKRDDGAGNSSRTLGRSGLWAAQTPQLFLIRRLIDALRQCFSENFEPTDEAAAMELVGARPKLVMGSSANLKITYPDDVHPVENWLREKHRKPSG